MIDIYLNVCHNRVCGGNDKVLIFIKNVRYCSHIAVTIGVPGGVGTYDNWCSRRCWYI